MGSLIIARRLRFVKRYLVRLGSFVYTDLCCNESEFLCCLLSAARVVSGWRVTRKNFDLGAVLRWIACSSISLCFSSTSAAKLRIDGSAFPPLKLEDALEELVVGFKVYFESSCSLDSMIG